MRPRLLISLISLGLLAPILVARADRATSPFLDGLLQRHLFSLAEATCHHRLAKTPISPRDRAEATVDLSRTYAERALNSPPADRARWWDKAHEIITRYEQEAGRARDVDFLVRRQAAMVHLARGELARHEASIAADKTALRDQARRDLRQAIARLKQLREQVQQALVARAEDEVTSGQLTQNALHHLTDQLDYELARSFRNQALCYEPDSADRLHAIQRALGQLETLTARTDPIDWKSRLERLTCLRLAEDPAAFQQAARDLQAAKPPASVAARIALEVALEQLDRGDTQAALVALRQTPPFAPAIAAEWDFARLQALLAAWRSEKDEQIARQWQAQASAQVAKIEQRYGDYWMRRAEGVMARHVTSDTQTADLALLTRAAIGLYRAGKLPDAVSAYDRARTEAQAADQRQTAFELGFAAAGIEQQQAHYSEAQARYQQLATTFHDLPEASRAHLLAVFSAAQAMRTDETPDVVAYIGLLNEHLDEFPHAPTADQARWWLAKVYLAQHQWQTAIDVLKGLSVNDKQTVAALDAISHSFRQQLARDTITPKTRAALTEEAASYFAGQAADLKSADARVAAATEAARFYLQKDRIDVQEQSAVDQLLAMALGPDAAARPKKRVSAGLLQVDALARKPGRIDDAIATYDKNKTASVEDLLDLVDRLGVRRARGASTRRRDVARLCIHVGEDLVTRTDTFDERAKQRLHQSLIAAYLESGEHAKALRLSGSLAKAFPDRGDLQARHAQLLLDGNDRPSWQAALLKWRSVERRSWPGTARWFDAKYAQAVAHQRLGNDRQAIRIISMTRVLHPDLGDPERKGRFLKLLRQCQPKIEPTSNVEGI